MAMNYVDLGSVYTKVGVDGNVAYRGIDASTETQVGNIAGTIATDYTFASSNDPEGQVITLSSAHAWTITGTAGNDVIYGGSGDDTFTGGGATVGDTIYGGMGKDTFMAKGNVVAKDFNFGEDVVNAGAGVLNAGNYYDGKVLNGANTVTVGKINNYSKVTVVSGPASTVTGDVWFGSSTAAFMDARTQTSALTMIGNNVLATVADTIYGGAGKDTIYAGVNDIVWGGKGDDSISVSGANVTVGLTANGGTDTVAGFVTGFDASNSVVYLYDNVFSNATADAVVSTTGTQLLLTDGSAQLNIRTTAADVQNFLLKDSTGTTKKVSVTNGNVALYSGTITPTADQMADIYVGAKDTTIRSAANFAYASTGLTIDLGNTGLYGDTREYKRIVDVRGSEFADKIFGAASTADSLVGGAKNDTLWGGGASNDTLVGGADKDVFEFGAGDGKDVVTDFVAADDTFKMLTNSAVSVTANVGNIVVGIGSDSLTLRDGTTTFVSSTGTTINAVAADGTALKADIGLTDTANTLTYASDVTYFYGGTKADTLKVADNGDDKIWLNGKTGQKYIGVENIDATGALGALELAGSGAVSNTIYGGAGASSIFGGTGNVSDTLIGGTGNDSFFYGLGDGKDIVAAGTESVDKVMLYNVAVSDITSAKVASGVLTVAMTDGGTLTVNGFGDGTSALNSFTLKDGTTYTYDNAAASSKWKVKA